MSSYKSTPKDNNNIYLKPESRGHEILAISSESIFDVKKKLQPR